MTGKAAALPATLTAAPKSKSRDGVYAQARREFVRNRVALLGVVLLVAITLAAIFAPLLTPYNPINRDAKAQTRAPSWDHPMGTDSLGRDVLSRVLYGGRISLQVGFFSVVASTLAGVPLGLAAGYFGGWIDNAIMRVMDVILAFPGLILVIWLVAMLGASLINVIIAITVFSLPTYARLARGITLSAREMEYVVAARSMGAGSRHILASHILPSVVGSMIVLTTLSISGAIVTGASLSFLGLGIGPPTPEWGAMLSDGRGYMRNAWWIAVFPGLVITLVVLSANIVGDALRDALDPKTRTR
jgi:peptide/nickel transport system permease protein